MSIPLCKSDSVVKLLRGVFGSNILRVPEERYEPLTVLAAKSKSASFRGRLEPLVQGDPPFAVSADLIVESRVVDLCGSQTRTVKADLGLKILDGFLRGFGLPGLSLDAHLKVFRKISFHFQDVYRKWVDINTVGGMLAGRRIKRQNPAAAVFFGKDPYVFLVIDSVIVSRSFGLTVEGGTSGALALDVPAIAQAAAAVNPKVQVSSTSSLEVSFQGQTRLAFAFSCVRFALDQRGGIGALLPTTGNLPVRYRSLVTKGLRGGDRSGVVYAPDRVLLASEPEMLDIS